MRLRHGLEQILLRQKGHLFPWAPVCLGFGIACYFALLKEPTLLMLWASGAIALLAAGLAVIWRDVFTPLIWMVALFAAGFALAGARAHIKAAPVLTFRYYGPVEGRIIYIDRSSTGALRIMLDQVVLRGVAPDATPKYVRVALRQLAEQKRVRPGSLVTLTAHLAGPSGPVEPHGFDFQRNAWFRSLGAIGYARTPLMLLAYEGNSRPVLQARHKLARFVREHIEGEPGAFAAAIMTGDRSGLSLRTVESLRQTNLAHLLAISGLHMALLITVVFTVTRSVLLFVPAVYIGVSSRNIAAITALCASLAYLVLSGGSVATERAFIMATVALGAMLFQRRVISLRAVALAALIVLVVRPEALLGPGFQMSFAATTGLVCAFAALRDFKVWLGPNWARPVSTVLISSLVAGLATAPVSAAHFNQFAHYGLIANVLSVPMMGVLVVPAGVLALLLYPLGLSGVGFWAMGLGCKWILSVAAQVSALEGARGTVVQPDPYVLSALMLGALLLLLWQGRLRFIGAVPVMLALVAWGQTERPDILIEDQGKLVGLMSNGERVFSKAKGSGFVARTWLENDGDARTQVEAAQAWDDASQQAHKRLRHIWRKADLENLNCAVGELLIVPIVVNSPLPCEVYDLARLRRSGSVSLTVKAGVLKEKTAREISGRRLWSSQIRSDQ